MFCQKPNEEMVAYKRWRPEKEGIKKKNGYILETGHSAKWVYWEVVLELEGKLLCYYKADCGKLCCLWTTKESLKRQGFKVVT